MKPAQSLSRRQVLQTAVGVAAAVAVAPPVVATAQSAAALLKGHINHSVVHWCYKDQWKTVDEFCRNTKALGAKSVELIDPEHWPTLKEHGLTCAIVGSHMFVRGMNNPKHWDECLPKMRERIEAAAAFGCPNVITFTGYREPGITDDIGLKNCVEGYKKIVGFAEEKKVTLCLEMLNSRVANHPMKGHPGYQGDHVDYCIELLKQVGSPRLKLLFDVYHVQIMDGDVITRLQQYKDYIGHIHTAGNPGRGELDATQEINYPPIMKTLVDIGYKGYVGHEFIPTRDAKAGLTEAISVCDV